MFKKIKEFISAFNYAYNTISSNKIDARKAIDDYKQEVNKITYATDSLKIIFTRLKAIYSYFPIKERRDFIQKTMDLLVYGRLDVNGVPKDISGWYTLYCSQEEYVNTKLKHLNELYREGKYSEVMSLAREYHENLKEFYVLYGVKENPSEMGI